jgi:toxin ParE2
LKGYAFHPGAAAELDAAVMHYEAQQPGLGGKFLDAVVRTIALVTRFPQAAPPISPRSRRCRVRGFPYGVIYQIREDKISVISVIGVMHLHRRPGYWRDREA